jgi:hypothetical protein
VHRLAYQVQAMDSNRKAQILSEWAESSGAGICICAE